MSLWEGSVIITPILHWRKLKQMWGICPRSRAWSVLGLGYIYEPWFWDLFSGWLHDAVSLHTSYVVIWLQKRPGKQTSLAVMGQLRLQGGEHGRGRHQGVLFCCQHPAAVLSTHHLRELCNCHRGVLSLVLIALMVWIVLCGSYFHAVSKPVKVN